MIRILCTMMSMVLWSCLVPLWAQTTDTTRIHRLPDVVVHGDAAQRSLRSASPVQTVGRDDILRLGVTDVADALHRLPGVTLRDYGGAGGMKTVSVRGFGAQHTGVSYDGVMLSEIQSGEIDVARYSMDLVQTMRLTIGDGDDLFLTARQATTPAVLSIETLSAWPTDRQAHLTTQLRIGSWGYTSGLARYTQRLSGRLAVQAVGEYVYADNDYPFKLRNGNTYTIERRTNSRMNSGHAEMSAYWATGSRSSLWGKVYYYDNDRQLPGIVQHYTNVCGQQLRERNAFGQARWLYQPSDRVALRLIGKYNWASSAYRDTLLPDRRDDATYWQREYYASASVLYTPLRQLSASYAADYYYNTLTSTLSTDRRPWRHTLLQTAAVRYATGRLTAQARLLWTLCLNGAHTPPTQSDMRRWSPSLALSYRLLGAEPLYLRASVKDIFRVPTFNECYFHHYGSADIRPERTRQYNLGLTWQHAYSPRLTTRLTADGYINRISDKIVAVPYNMFIWRTVNMARVRGYGADVSLRTEWTCSARHRIDLTGGYSYQRVANRTQPSSPHYGKQVPYQPLNSGSMALGWTNPWVCVALHGSASSGRWATPNHYDGTHLAGYMDMGVTAYRHIPLRGSRLEVRADIENMLGRQYAVVAGYPMPRAHWRISLTWQM